MRVMAFWSPSCGSYHVRWLKLGNQYGAGGEGGGVTFETVLALG